MDFRKYRPADCEEMASLFYDTVHTVNAADYTKEQLDAWASGHVDLDAWDRSFLEHDTIVAFDDAGHITGFGDMDHTGYLDRLYVHRDHQREGIAKAICDRLESGLLTREKTGKFTTHASVTAKGFFEKRGYRTVREQQVERSGVLLKNFVMEKQRGE